MKNKKTLIAIIYVVSVILVLIGVTYAYWLVTKEQQGENVISSACLDISLNGSNDINLPDSFPMSDEDGMATTPYTFTVTNNCTTSVDYQVNLETLGEEEDTIIPSAIKIAINDEVSLLRDKVETTPTLSDAYTARKILTGTLAGKSDATTEDAVTYELRIWIDKDAPISEQNKTFTSKITVTIGQGIFNPYQEGTLAYSILSNYGGISAITEITDFSNVADTEAETGLFKTLDDQGVSYYFRGVPDNNYLYLKTNPIIYYYEGVGPDGENYNGYFETEYDCWNFEDNPYDCVLLDEPIVEERGYYWRILRINGDGSIRLIFDGTEKIENGIEHNATIFDEVTYGDTTIFTEANFLTDLNNWYTTNIENAVGDSIADTYFCNDNSVGNTFYEYGYDDYGNYSDEIIGSYDVFNSYYRIINLKPQLTCNQESDILSVKNGKLSKPIGLITADEAMFAGLKMNSEAGNNYLGNVISDNGCFFSMTPVSTGWYDEENYTVFYGKSFFAGDLHFDPINSYYGSIRPVISLKANVKFTGNGSYETPYELVME